MLDYYAVLQVHPDADAEVIEAAYRQLMKKHHPDVAGADPARAAAHHERSKAINEAFRVLRDPWTRREYDELRSHGYPRGERVPTQPPSSPPGWASASSRGQQPAAAVVVGQTPLDESPWLAPFKLVADAYYLLPGRYEWESGRRTELLAVVLVPLVGTAGFCLATGRLSALIGPSLSTTLVAWALLVVATIPLWPALPRIAMASIPSLTLLTGALTPFLALAHIPLWLAWPTFVLLSLLLSARLYVFGVLPTLALCWLVTRLTSS